MWRTGAPWRDAGEWRAVCAGLEGQDEGAGRGEALEALAAWKARAPGLAAGLESTLALLEVGARAGQGDERAERLAHSAAVMRFVNHALDGRAARGVSLYRAAREAGLPDWLVELRHAAAHGDTLPALSLLRRAAAAGLAWLRARYWRPQADAVRDYVVGARSLSDRNRLKLSRIIAFYASLSVCGRSECEIRNLAQVPDDETRESMIREARELLEGYDLSEPSLVSISSLLNRIENQSIGLLNTPDAAAVINKTILEPNSLFLSLEILQLFDNKSFYENATLNTEYIMSWELLLTFLHTNNLMATFLVDLTDVSKDPEREDMVRKLAAVWTKEILRGLKKSKLYLEKYYKSDLRNGSSPNKRMNHKINFKKLFPHEKKGLILNLLKPIPEEIRTLAFILPILTSYNPYLIYFVKDLLSISKPQLPKECVDKFFKLANLISGLNTNGNNIPKDKIFTISDVNMENCIESKEDSEDSDCMEISLVMDEVNMELEAESAWKLETEHDWSQCPIGTVPWKMKTVML